MNGIVVTGAAGFLGFHLCHFYLKKKYVVFGFDNFITGQKENVQDLETQFPNRFFFQEHDVCKKIPPLVTTIENNPVTIEFIFHFASVASVPHYQKFSLETLVVNSLGLQNCLETAALYNHAKVIFASTSEIYGDPLTSPQKESDWGHVNPYGPRSCYDEAKRFGEALIYSWNLRYQTHHGIIRIFNTYGPRMNLEDGRVVLRMIIQALENKPISVYGNGQQSRSFCYVDDLIYGIYLSAKSSFYKPLNLGRAEPVQIIGLAQQIIKLTDSRSEIHFFDLPTDDPQQRSPDLSLAKAHLGYESKVNLTLGLNKTIEWLKKRKEFQRD